VLQIAAKQLQLATWLLLTAYRNLPMPYPTVLSTTLYDVPFSHNAKRYRQTDRRQTDRTPYHKRDRTTQYGRLITALLQRQVNILSTLSAQVTRTITGHRQSTAIFTNL